MATLASSDARKTYRYLRIGMIGAVVLLAISIAIEHGEAHCWQTSVSAYYYTPVRAIFVGAMFVVGFSLIVIKGRTVWEDSCLNMAGILAPVVAVAPTMDVGPCWSVPPIPPPTIDGSPAEWVVQNIENNFQALLIVGAFAVILALVLFLLTPVLVNRGSWGPDEQAQKWTLRSILGAAGALLISWWLFVNWDDFDTRAHGFSALLMFVFLIAAVGGKAWEHRRESTSGYFPLYAAIALVMAIGGIVIVTLRIGDEFTVFWLEAFEIVLFAVFWTVQTVENWKEDVVIPPTPAT